MMPVLSGYRPTTHISVISTERYVAVSQCIQCILCLAQFRLCRAKPDMIATEASLAKIPGKNFKEGFACN